MTKLVLDLNKNVEENAEVYFNKAKKIKKKLEGAKEAAKIFVDQLDSDKDRVGLVQFHTVASLREHLTNDFADVKSSINLLSGGGWTNIGDGIDYSTDEYDYDGRGGNRNLPV